MGTPSQGSQKATRAKSGTLDKKGGSKQNGTVKPLDVIVPAKKPQLRPRTDSQKQILSLQVDRPAPGPGSVAHSASQTLGASQSAGVPPWMMACGAGLIILVPLLICCCLFLKTRRHRSPRHAPPTAPLNRA